MQVITEQQMEEGFSLVDLDKREEYKTEMEYMGYLVEGPWSIPLELNK